jgi:hypothetical protein
VADESKSLWRLWELLAVIVGAIASLELTHIFPALYWPGVALVYFGLIGMVIGGARGKWNEHIVWKIAICTVGAVGILWWSFDVVFAKVSPSLGATTISGDYPSGSDIAGIKWNSGMYEEVSFHITNSTGYDITDLDLILSSDLWVTGVGQLEPVCAGIRVFPVDSSEAYLDLKEEHSGKTIQTPPVVPIDVGNPSRIRVVCDKFPRHSSISLVVAIVSFNRSNGAEMPKQLFTAKRPPDWFGIQGEYMALGRERGIDQQFSFNGYGNGTPMLR